MKGDTKWWNELKMSVDGDRAPARGEGWNHPVAGEWPFASDQQMTSPFLTSSSHLGNNNARRQPTPSGREHQYTSGRLSAMGRPQHPPVHFGRPPDE